MLRIFNKRVLNVLGSGVLQNRASFCLLNHSVPLEYISEPNNETAKEISASLQLHLEFVNENEEKDLLQEINPLFRRLRYQKDHWDNAIVGYRETEYSRWNSRNLKVINRILKAANLDSNDEPISYVHLLDLEEDGVIMPHVDSVRYCGNKIAGLSLLTDSIMRFRHVEDKSRFCDVLVKRRSLYIMSGTSRYDYTHELLPDNSTFKDTTVKKSRRLSVICRSKPPVHYSWFIYRFFKMLRKQGSISVAESSQFRRIDVDEYIGSSYKDDDDTNAVVEGPNETEVNALLGKGDIAAALIYALKTAPIGSKDQAVKDKAFGLVMRILVSFKSSAESVESVIKRFDTDLVDTMMKYIYRAFATTPDENFPSYLSLLSWHDRLYSVGGHGSIIRVMTDRRKV